MCSFKKINDIKIFTLLNSSLISLILLKSVIFDFYLFCSLDFFLKMSLLEIILQYCHTNWQPSGDSDRESKMMSNI